MKKVFVIIIDKVILYYGFIFFIFLNDSIWYVFVLFKKKEIYSLFFCLSINVNSVYGR